LHCFYFVVIYYVQNFFSKMFVIIFSIQTQAQPNKLTFTINISHCGLQFIFSYSLF